MIDKGTMKLLKYILPVLFTSVCLYSQSTRSLVNDGVDMYKNKKYQDAEVNFKKGIDSDTNNFHARYNLGDTYYRQGKYDEAVKSFNHSVLKAKSKEDQAKSFYNMGSSFVKAEKYQEAVDAYKKALKLNPKDMDAKNKLSYAINKLKNNQNQNKNKNKQNKNDKNNKDKNKDQNKDQNKDNKNNKDNNKNNQNKNDQNKQNDKQDQNKQNQNPKPNESKMSKQEAERILDAIKNNEQDLQKQLRKKSGVPVKTDKDW